MPRSSLEAPSPKIGDGCGRTPARGRVLLLLTNLSPAGGAEVQSIQLALRLKQRGWDLQMAALLPVRHQFPELEQAGIPVYSANMNKGPAAAAGILPLIRLIRRFKPDVLHCHMAQAILAGRLTRTLTGIPVVIGTLHGLMMYSVSGRHQLWMERFHRFTDSLADVTTIVCQIGLNYYYDSKTVSGERLRYIPNGVDTKRFNIDPQLRASMRNALQLGNDFSWLCVGRFDPIKDHRVALESFALTLPSRPHSQLLLAGDGALHGQLRAQARQLGIEKKVQFLGARADIEDVMNAADALLLTSRFEALPLVLLEGAACGLPAVATHVGGNEEAIINEETGFLAPVGDAVQIAESMTRLTGLDPSHYRQMSAAARNHAVRSYEFDFVVDQWEALYESELQRKGACR